MDKKHFELLLRNTPFSRALVVELWDGLSTFEHINILIQLNSITKELFKKAFNDVNSVVRMLAVKSFYIDQSEEPELYEKIKSDISPFVQAAIKEKSLESDFNRLGFEEEIEQLSQLEKLGAVALSDSIIDEEFADFIVKGIENQIISEDEASELVFEFVGNPNCKYGLEIKTRDGLLAYSIQKGFEKMWNLTTCTSHKVHYAIAWRYPLTTGNGGKIPKEILNKMGNQVLETLVYRNYQPLLDLIEKNPKNFDEEIHKAIETNSDYSTSTRICDPFRGNDMDLLRVELLRVKEEINDRIDALTQQLRDSGS